MIVVADSSPLHYLILIGQAELLHRFYAEVLIPDAVASELSAAQSPSAVRGWLSGPPAWLRVMTVNAQDIAAVSEDLDLGERAAIALAERAQADLLLIDESAGRAEARKRKIRVTGLLGVLRTAAEMGVIDVPEVLARLAATSFYVDDALLQSVFGTWIEE